MSWLKQQVTAYRERERELTERFHGVLGMAAWVTRAEELELAQLYAAQHLARNHPLLATLTTLEMIDTWDGEHELRMRARVGYSRHQEQDFAGHIRFQRHISLTYGGMLMPAVRIQIDETLRGAESTIAEAIAKGRT